MSTTTRQRKRSLIGAVAVALVVLVGVMVVVGMIQRWRDKATARDEFRAVLAELDANEPGWRLADLEAARAAVPLEENSARVVAAVGPKLPFFEPVFGNWPRATNQRYPEEWFAKQRTRLGKGSAVIADARALADQPRGRFDVLVDHRFAFHSEPGHFRDVRMVGNLLLYDAIDRAHAGDGNSALTSCRAALNAARSIGDEPVLTTQRYRLQIGASAAEVALHCLSLTVAEEKALAELQRLATVELSHDALLCGWRGKRAALGALLEGLDAATIRLADLKAGQYLVSRPGWSSAGFQREQAVLMRLANRIVENAKLPLHEQDAGEKLLDIEIEHGHRTNSLTGELFIRPSVGSAYRASMVTLRCLVILLAAECFRMKHASWPDRIDDLMPDWLTVIPRDPFDGKPMRFMRLPDGVVAYSVGHNGTDDDGNIDHRLPGGGTDLGHRLWDVDKRNVAAKPRLPAK